jgi:hypothetical protein
MRERLRLQAGLVAAQRVLDRRAPAGRAVSGCRLALIATVAEGR